MLDTPVDATSEFDRSSDLKTKMTARGVGEDERTPELDLNCEKSTPRYDTAIFQPLFPQRSTKIRKHGRVRTRLRTRGVFALSLCSLRGSSRHLRGPLLHHHAPPSFPDVQDKGLVSDGFNHWWIKYVTTRLTANPETPVALPCADLSSSNPSVEVIGFSARGVSASETPGCWSVGPYTIASIFVLLPPALFAASIYMILGRIILLTDGETHAIIRRQWLTKIFVTGDVISFLLQGSGRSRTSVAPLLTKRRIA